MARGYSGKSNSFNGYKTASEELFLHVMDQKRWCPKMELVLQAKSLFNLCSIKRAYSITLQQTDRMKGTYKQ